MGESYPPPSAEPARPNASGAVAVGGPRHRLAGPALALVALIIAAVAIVAAVQSGGRVAVLESQGAAGREMAPAP
jgi:hypothetical protein